MNIINKRTALTMFFNAGYTTHEQLFKASDLIESVAKADFGYWYVSDISKLIEKNSK